MLKYFKTLTQLKPDLDYKKKNYTMEYNLNTYITIAHTTCEALGLGETHRMNNDETICILEFGEGETIPLEITENIIDTYTHQEALTLINTAEWKSNLQL